MSISLKFARLVESIIWQVNKLFWELRVHYKNVILL